MLADDGGHSGARIDILAHQFAARKRSQPIEPSGRQKREKLTIVRGAPSSSERSGRWLDRGLAVELPKRERSALTAAVEVAFASSTDRKRLAVHSGDFAAHLTVNLSFDDRLRGSAVVWRENGSAAFWRENAHHEVQIGIAQDTSGKGRQRSKAVSRRWAARKKSDLDVRATSLSPVHFRLTRLLSDAYMPAKEVPFFFKRIR